MGLRIKLKDTNFENFIGYSLDINHPNLIGYYLFDSSGVVRNRVSNQSLSKIGNPVFGSNNVIVTAANGFVDSALVNSGDITYIAIANAGASAVVCGHVDYNISPATSDAILRNASKFTLLCNNVSLAEPAARVAATRFIAGVIGDTSKDLYVSDLGALVKTSGTKTQGNPNSLPFKMGAHSQNGVLPDQTTLYAVAVFSKALTQVEIEGFYAQFKELFPFVA